MNSRKIIPYGKQEITESDIDSVVKTLKGDFLTQGPMINKFELEFSKYIGSKYAVAVSNGTAALHLSCISLGVKKGSKVITTPLSFIASSNAVLYCGGEIDFCDINPETYLIDINIVREKLMRSPRGTYSGIIVVDFAGYPAQMDQFKELADEYGLWILEDSCHSPGGWFCDKKNKLQNCGNGNYADLAIFSFHPVKHIACGEGGMITTNNELLYKQLIQVRSHGIVRENNIRDNEAEGWYYEMQNLGYNYRLSDINSTLGISQLKRAKKNLLKRKDIAKKYETAFKNNEHIKIIPFLEGHAYHLYVIQTNKRKELYNYLKLSNIFTQVHYIPIHLHPYYKQFGWKKNQFPEVENYYDNCLSLPIFPSLSKRDQEYVIQKILKFDFLK